MGPFCKRLDVKQISKQTSARLTVDLASLRQNWRFLKNKVNSSDCAAVLKANAYGLGLAEVASALRKDVKTFFVAHLEEGKKLRSVLPNHRIFVLHGCTSEECDDFIRYKLLPVINTPLQARKWYRLCLQKGHDYPVALQVDSGMSRFGLSEEDLDCEEIHGLRIVLIMSHLACADQPDHPANEQQRREFVRLSGRFPGVPRSLAASSGIFLGEKYHFDMVRPGAALYGVAPNAFHTRVLKQVVRLDARILQIRQIPPRTCVGYGLTWETDRERRIATVGIGYADGFMRSMSQKASLWWQDHRLPVLGRVSMDSLSVDISDVKPDFLEEGMWLSVIGTQQDVDVLAQAAGTIGYEILTSLGDRFSRIYHDNA